MKQVRPGYFIGVDGGGTKTKAVVLNADKETVASVETGSTNHNSVGKDTARANLKGAILGAVSLATVTISNVAGICCGISGCGINIFFF